MLSAERGSRPLRLRMPLPAGVALFDVPATRQAEIALVLGAELPRYPVATLAECQTLLAKHVGLAVMLVVPPLDDERRLQEIGALRKQFPHVEMLCLFDEQMSDLRCVARLGYMGVREVLSSSKLLREDALLCALARGEVATVATRAWSLAGLHLDDGSATLLKAAVRLAHTSVSVARFADAARMHERTLRKHCELCDLPSPQWIVGWARCLIAAFYLEEPGRTIQSVAELLHFRSPASLSNHLRRYTGLTPTALRRRGALGIVGRSLEDWLERHRNALRARRPAPALTLLR